MSVHAHLELQSLLDVLTTVGEKARLSGLPGSPSGLNTGNGIEGAMVCNSLGSLLGPLFPVFNPEGEPGISLHARKDR